VIGLASYDPAPVLVETMRLPFALTGRPVFAAFDDLASVAGDGGRSDPAAVLGRMLLGLDEAAHAVDVAQRRISTLRESQQDLRALIEELLIARPSSGVEPFETGWVAAALPFALGIVDLPLPAPPLDERPSVKPSLTVRLLGRFEVEVNGRSLPAWRSRRARRLFAYLGLNRREDVSRHRLMGLFWPDHSEDRAENNLSLAIMALRRLIDPPGIGAASLVGFRAGCYFIDAADIRVDTEEFTATVAEAARLEARGEVSAASQALDTAIGLYYGDLLPAEPYEEWTIGPRRRLQDTFAEALQRRARIARAQSDYEMSVRLTSRLLDGDPANEEAHRQLISDYGQLGQRSRAVAQMDACRLALRVHLGVQPDPETLLLFARVTGRDPA
jgi:DNA-binding SARP family transcriptional activator